MIDYRTVNGRKYKIISTLPTEIREAAERAAKEYKRQWPNSEEIKKKTIGNAFSWHTTEEGTKIWAAVNRGDYGLFYDRYNKSIDNFSII